MYEVVEQFEKAIAEYCGSPYACVVNSCTNALLLACAYNNVKEVTIPKHTYIGVPMSIIHAGGTVKFDDREWQDKGQYFLRPYPIIDSARLLTNGMYDELVEWQCTHGHKQHTNAKEHTPGGDRPSCSECDTPFESYYIGFIKPFVCLSLHWGKTLNLGQGGVILHSDPEAQEWFKKARFDGRTPGVHPKDDNPILGWHCYMSPRDAADALTRLHFLPKYNDPLPYEPNYPDLSKLNIFKVEKETEWTRGK